MAELKFTVTYPDDKQDDLLLALRHHYGKKDDGTDYTPLELRGMLQTKVVGEVRRIYLKWKEAQTNLDDLGAA